MVPLLGFALGVFIVFGFLAVFFVIAGILYNLLPILLLRFLGLVNWAIDHIFGGVR